MMDQRIDERAGPIAVAWMHDKTGRLVYDDQVRVLVKDVKWDRLALGRCIVGFRDGDRNAEAFAQLVLGFHNGLAVNAHLALPNERLNAISRQIGGQLARKPGIQPLAGSFLVGN